MSDIKFIDVKTSNVFDGSSPYIFFFDGGQSVNLQYIKQICFVTTKKTVKITIPDDETNICFKLIDTSKINTNQLSTELDIDSISSYSILSTGTKYASKVYVHMLYILAVCDSAGEYVEEFTIDDQKFSIGADFYIEDERLIENLKNFGVEIPSYIQRAIYEANVHEPAIDNILMNRKWKELLLEYVNIIANKGSYNSLINSLEWFEWGDLLSLEEYWKYQNYDKVLLSGKLLNSVTNQQLKTELKNYAKTTYIGLYAALDKIVVNEYDEIEYEDTYYSYWKYLTINGRPVLPAYTNPVLVGNQNTDNRILQIGGVDETDKTVEISDEETQPTTYDTDGAWFNRPETTGVLIIDERLPKLEKVSYIWSQYDIALKMTLLGNYFKTYFMPIHLDLINSTIQNLVYTNTIKVNYGVDKSRQDQIFHDAKIICNIKDDSIVRLEDVHTFVYPSTPVSLQYTDGDYSQYILDEDYLAFGVDVELKEEITTQAALKTFSADFFGGIGAVVDFEFCLVNNDKHRFVNKIQLFDNDSKKFIEDDKIYACDSESEDYNIYINPHILLRKTGCHNIRFAFYTNVGECLVYAITIYVVDNSWQPLTLYKIKRSSYENIFNMFESGEFVFNFASFMYSQHHDENDYSTEGVFELDRYSQFLPYSLNDKNNAMGLNHFVKIDTSCEEFSVDNSTTPYTLDSLINLLKTNHYFVDYDTSGFVYAVNPYFYKNESENSENYTIPYIDKTINIPSLEISTDIIVNQISANNLTLSLKNFDEDFDDLDTYIMISDRKLVWDNFVKTDDTWKSSIDLANMIVYFGKSDLDIKVVVRYKKNNLIYDMINETIKFKNVSNKDSFSNITSMKIAAWNDEDEDKVISEIRFFPLFHEIEEFNNEEPITDNELIVVVPNIPMSLKNEKISTTWKFTNESTHEDIDFRPKHYKLDDYDLNTILSETIINDFPVSEPIIYRQRGDKRHNKKLENGYYTICLEYSLGGTVVNTTQLKHAFRKI